jgi:hypothetical protein
MRRRRYIHDGTIIGDPMWIQKPWHAYIEWKRVACILLPMLVLSFTNPANQQAWKQSASTSTKKFRWLTHRVTNYGILSLEERIDGVVILGLNRNIMCSFRSPKFGTFCESLGM